MTIDDNFELPELGGKVLEEILGVRFAPKENSPTFKNEGVELNAVILRLKDVAPLQLFYLDAGLSFWEELAPADYPDYVNQSEVFSLDAAGKVRGQKIVRAGGEGCIDKGIYCNIVVRLERGRIELLYDDKKKKTLLILLEDSSSSLSISVRTRPAAP